MQRPKITAFVVVGWVDKCRRYPRYPWDEPALLFMAPGCPVEYLLREITDDVLRDLPGYGVSNDPDHRSYWQ